MINYTKNEPASIRVKIVISLCNNKLGTLRKTNKLVSAPNNNPAVEFKGVHSDVQTQNVNPQNVRAQCITLWLKVRKFALIVV